MKYNAKEVIAISPVSEKQAKARDKWDSENMSYQTIKLHKSTLETFRLKCQENGDKVNTVLRKAIEEYNDTH